MYKLLITFLILSQSGYTQTSSDTIYLEKKLVQYGYLLKYKDCSIGICDPENYVTIFSKTKEVFALESGVLKVDFILGGDKYIGIESGDFLIIYGKITTNKKQGDIIKKNELVGFLNVISDDCFNLIISIFDRREGSTCNYLELENFLVNSLSELE